ncbi:MAG: tRNA (N6-isopentenyl adenosine(37)-C2)-methylthiotransferase MiaB [Rhodospirillales bacterium]
MSLPAKSLFIKSYGCQMNAYDAARMADVLAPLGYVSVDSPEGADLAILNTCHIREKAAEKIYSDLGRLKVMQREKRASGGRMLIGVGGCVAQAEGAEIIRRAPYVDLVFGPQTYHRLAEMTARALRDGAAQVDVDFPAEQKFDHLPEVTGASANIKGGAAFVTVQEGCDKFCTFCVVPYTRGAETSRPARDVLAEIRRFAALGVREVTLLGQNVDAYHGAAAEDGSAAGGEDGGEWSLGRLIRAAAEIEGIARIRYTTSYPADVDDDLITAHRDVPQLTPFLHLPVQSGSDAVLRAMNRRHTAGDYRRLVSRLREARPDLALSSDFIVGFPGETESDFDATLALVEDVGFTQAYSFKYSPRPGTPAAAFAGQVAPETASERLLRLQTLLNAQQQAFNESCAGRVMDVLLERPGRRPGQLAGRSPYMQAVHLNAPPEMLGHIVSVRITGAGPHSLAGELADQTGQTSQVTGAAA